MEAVMGQRVVTDRWVSRTEFLMSGGIFIMHPTTLAVLLAEAGDYDRAFLYLEEYYRSELDRRLKEKNL